MVVGGSGGSRRSVAVSLMVIEIVAIYGYGVRLWW